jgi:hypothetical protein
MGGVDYTSTVDGQVSSGIEDREPQTRSVATERRGGQGMEGSILNMAALRGNAISLAREPGARSHRGQPAGSQRAVSKDVNGRLGGGRRVWLGSDTFWHAMAAMASQAREASASWWKPMTERSANRRRGDVGQEHFDAVC